MIFVIALIAILKLSKFVRLPTVTRIVVLVGALLFASNVSTACRILEDGEQAAGDDADRAQMAALVSSTGRNADLIFVGRAVSVDALEEVDGVKRYAATFEINSMVRGSDQEPNALYWEQSLSSTVVGCTEASRFNDVDIVETDRYLVYVNGREIVRARPLLDRMRILSVDDELRILQPHD